VAQDFWASSGYRHLDAGHGGLVATNAWLATFLQRPELLPPEDAGPNERAVHALACANPRATITAGPVRNVSSPSSTSTVPPGTSTR